MPQFYFWDLDSSDPGSEPPKLLFVSDGKGGGKIAFSKTCCCDAGPCVKCAEDIQGVVFELSDFIGDVDGSGNPIDCCSDDDGDGIADDCCWCSDLNGSWFVPWDVTIADGGDADGDACRSSKNFLLDERTCGPPGSTTTYDFEIWLSYTINIQATVPPTLLLSGTIDIGYTGSSACGDTVNVNCTKVIDDTANVECRGIGCTDDTPVMTLGSCDVTNAKVTMTIV